jgi:hypothetical protein
MLSGRSYLIGLTYNCNKHLYRTAFVHMRIWVESHYLVNHADLENLLKRIGLKGLPKVSGSGAATRNVLLSGNTLVVGGGLNVPLVIVL